MRPCHCLFSNMLLFVVVVAVVVVCEAVTRPVKAGLRDARAREQAELAQLTPDNELMLLL